MAITNQHSPMAAVGSYDSILPFKAIGLDVVVVSDENILQVPQIISKFAKAGYAALFVEETLYERFNEAVSEISESSDMCTIPVPNQSGSAGIGLSLIRRNVERAVGMDIFGVK